MFKTAFSCKVLLQNFMILILVLYLNDYSKHELMFNLKQFLVSHWGIQNVLLHLRRFAVIETKPACIKYLLFKNINRFQYRPPYEFKNGNYDKKRKI